MSTMCRGFLCGYGEDMEVSIVMGGSPKIDDFRRKILLKWMIRGNYMSGNLQIGTSCMMRRFSCKPCFTAPEENRQNCR